MYQVKSYQIRTQAGKVSEGHFSGFVGKLAGTTTDGKGNTFGILQNGPVRAIFRPSEIEPVASR